MKIVVRKTKDLNSSQWINYTTIFNQIFNKDLEVSHFKKKYFNTIKGYSYHAFLESDRNEIAGSCSIIPFEYFLGNNKHIFGLAVDAFVLKDYRRDPLVLFNLYSQLKELIIKEGVEFIISVPNEIAYPYWKKMVNWKDVGQIPYYALPIKIGNILKKNTWLNIFSMIGCATWIFLLGGLSNIFNSSEKSFEIRINRDNPILEEYRYSLWPYLIKYHKKNKFVYRIIDEEGIRTAYLIDFYNGFKKKDVRTLFIAVKHIFLKEKIDLIIFVGFLNFSQYILFRVPKSKEPKPLYLTGDILNKKINSQIIFNIRNWDFGLFNYDVR